MDIYERYDELDNIVTTLRYLAEEIKDKNYKETFDEIRYEAQDELEEVEEQIYEIEKAEQKELEREYDRERI